MEYSPQIQEANQKYLRALSPNFSRDELISYNRLGDLEMRYLNENCKFLDVENSQLRSYLISPTSITSLPRRLFDKIVNAIYWQFDINRKPALSNSGFGEHLARLESGELTFLVSVHEMNGEKLLALVATSIYDQAHGNHQYGRVAGTFQGTGVAQEAISSQCELLYEELKFNEKISIDARIDNAAFMTYFEIAEQLESGIPVTADLYVNLIKQLIYAKEMRIDFYLRSLGVNNICEIEHKIYEGIGNLTMVRKRTNHPTPAQGIDKVEAINELHLLIREVGKKLGANENITKFLHNLEMISSIQNESRYPSLKYEQIMNLVKVVLSVGYERRVESTFRKAFDIGIQNAAYESDFLLEQSQVQFIPSFVSRQSYLR